jgi:hypothetical protein
MEQLRHAGLGMVVPEGAVPHVWLPCSLMCGIHIKHRREGFASPTGLASAGRRGGMSRPWDSGKIDDLPTRHFPRLVSSTIHYSRFTACKVALLDPTEPH